DYIEQHKAEIEALQILYSRPFKKRLTEESLRELEAKLKPEFGPQPVPKLWNAFEKNGRARSPSAPKTKSQTRRFTDLVSLVRVALEQEARNTFASVSPHGSKRNALPELPSLQINSRGSKR